MEMRVLMKAIKYCIKDCENGRNGQNAENLWTWTGPPKFNIIALNKTKQKNTIKIIPKKCLIHDNHVSW
jgi:hypothetical protein